MKPSGAHTHPQPGSGLPAALAIITTAAVAASVAGPVVHAAAVLLRAVIIIVAATAAVVLTALTTFAVYRVRHPHPMLLARSPRAAGRTGPPHLSAAPRPAALGQPSPPAIHLHLHGTSPHDVAEVLARHFLTIEPQDRR
jgi:hypothetical protein